jgi:hypothetical protein
MRCRKRVSSARSVRSITLSGHAWWTTRSTASRLRIPGQGAQGFRGDRESDSGVKTNRIPGRRRTVIPAGRRMVFVRSRNGFRDARNVFTGVAALDIRTGTMTLPREDQSAGQETVHVMCPLPLCAQ